jgi:hypothetical protein
MRITREELDRFHRFGIEKLSAGEVFTWSELLRCWRPNHPAKVTRANLTRKGSLPVTQQALDRVHSFAVQILTDCDGDLTWRDILDAWNIVNPTDAEKEEMKRIIEEGLAAIEAGRFIPADEAIAELKQKYGLTSA